MNSITRHRIFLIDDQLIVSVALDELLNNSGEFEVCGIARSRNAVWAKLPTSAADLVIIELGVDGDAGLDLIQDLRLRLPEVRILCLSGHEELFFAERALRAGAVGYVMKTEPVEVLLEATRTALSGEVYLSKQMERLVLQRFAGAATDNGRPPINRLSNRELQVVHHIGESRDNRQIARLLSVSVKTVEAHRSKIKEKLHLRTTCDLIRFATQWVEREASFVD
jgi:DNA-binding NarL/FixJ family response regulator